MTHEEPKLSNWQNLILQDIAVALASTGRVVMWNKTQGVVAVHSDVWRAEPHSFVRGAQVVAAIILREPGGVQTVYDSAWDVVPLPLT